MLRKLSTDTRFPCLKGWRDECYEIGATFGNQPFFQIERAAAPLFGIRKYGVHINGYVRDSERGVLVWFQRRSFTKQTYPGKIG